MKNKYNIGEIMETTLAREIRKVMNEEFIASIKEGRSADLTPMIFDSIEDENLYKKNFEEMINRDI